MDCSNKNCIIARLVILVVSIILAGIITGLAATVIPLAALFAALPTILAIGGVIAIAVFFAAVVLRPYLSVRFCVLCLGLLSFVAAVVLVVLSLTGIIAGPILPTVGALILVFVTALAFWIAVISFVAFTNCVARRNCDEV